MILLDKFTVSPGSVFAVILLADYDSVVVCCSCMLQYVFCH